MSETPPIAESPPVEPAATSDTLPPLKEHPPLGENYFPDDGGTKVKVKTVIGTNYVAAFTLLASGTATLPEIARAWNVPYVKIADRAKKENWSGLIRRYGHHFRSKSELPAPENTEAIRQKAEKIQANRDRTLSAAHGLMAQIQQTLDKHPKEIPMDPKSIGELARAVKMLGEISMVASGDEYAIKAATGTGSMNHRQAGTLIQINMPSVVAGPRKVKNIGEVIERATLAIEQDAIKQDLADDQAEDGIEEPEETAPVEELAKPEPVAG